MSLILLFKGAASAPPQTWSATAATINVAGTSRTFTAATTWTASTGTITIAGTSRTFTAATTWTATSGTITANATSGTLTGGATTWTANTATILIAATTGTFGPVTPTSTGSPLGGNYHPITFDYQQPQDDQLALILALI